MARPCPSSPQPEPEPAICPTAANPPRLTRPRRAPFFIAVILTILTLHTLGRTAAFCSPVRADSYAYGCIAYRVARGEPMYSPTLGDLKPPLVYYLYAVAYLFLPAGRHAMIPVDTAVALAGYWAFYRHARHTFTPAVSAILTVVMTATINAFLALDFATEGFGLSETFMILPAVLAAKSYLAATTRDQPRARTWLSCGWWLGLAFAVKQTAAALALAMVAHALLTRFGPNSMRRESKLNLSALLAGLLLAWAPWVILLAAQGDLTRAANALGPHAATMLTRQTALPSQLSDILPAALPLLWLAFASLWFIERLLRCSPRTHTPKSTSAGFDPKTAASAPTAPLHVPTFLLLWLACEILLLAFLPLRAFHYYALPAIPLVLLSGFFFQHLAQSQAALPRPRARAVACVAAALSMVVLLDTFNRITPMAIARARSYNRQADDAYFNQLVSRKTLWLGLSHVPRAKR